MKFMGMKQRLSNCWDWLWNEGKYALPESAAIFQYASPLPPPVFFVPILLIGGICAYGALSSSKETPISLPTTEKVDANSNLEKNLMNSETEL